MQIHNLYYRLGYGDIFALFAKNLADCSRKRSFHGAVIGGLLRGTERCLGACKCGLHFNDLHLWHASVVLHGLKAVVGILSLMQRGPGGTEGVVNS